MNIAVDKKTFIRRDTKIEKIVSSKVFWLVFIMAMFSYPLYRSFNRTLPDPLPVLYTVPDFEFTNEFGKPMGSKQLKGMIYLANFMFTSCPTTCPKLMGVMQKVQKRIRGLRNSATIVSFTVDPSYDTPKVLNKYARSLKTNPMIWTFLTDNNAEKMRKLITDGFKLAVGEREQQSVDVFDIAHSEKIALVDQKGRIRGFYSTDKDSINKLMIDVGLLANYHEMKR